MSKITNDGLTQPGTAQLCPHGNSGRQRVNSGFGEFRRIIVRVLQGSYAGNAVGFRVTSLTKLIDTRSNRPRLTLLHFLVDEVCRQSDDALQFVDDLALPLAVAARYERNGVMKCWRCVISPNKLIIYKASDVSIT